MGSVFELVLLAAALGLITILIVTEFGARRRRERTSDAIDGPPIEVNGKHYAAGRLDDSASGLYRRLRAAGIEMNPLIYVLLTFLAGLCAFLLVLEVFPGALAAATLVAVVVVYLVVSLVRDVAAWRARRFELELVDTIDLMCSALEGGENLPQAMESAAKASRPIVRNELMRVVDRLNLGVPIEQAIERMVVIYDSEGVRLFAQTLIAKWQAGGDLAPVLRSVSRLLREQVKLRLHLGSQLAGARFSSFLVAVIPYVLIPVFMWQQPGWIDTLFHHPQGPTLLFLAVCLQIIGFLWIRRLLRLKL